MRNEFGEKKFGHVNLKHISKLSKKNLVKGMPNICWKTHLLCEACQQGKHIKISFKSKDLFGLARTLSLGGKKYGFVIVNYYSRYTWLYFLAHKYKSFKVFEIFYKRVENEKVFCILSTMGLSLTMLSLDHYVKKMVFSTSSLHRELLKKMDS